MLLGRMNIDASAVLMSTMNPGNFFPGARRRALYSSVLTDPFDLLITKHCAWISYILIFSASRQQLAL